MILSSTTARLLSLLTHVFISALVLLGGTGAASAQCNPNLSLTHTGTACAGTDTLLLTGIDSALQITWYADTAAVSTGTDSIFVPGVAGTYYAVVATATCADTTGTITVSALPSATVTVQGSLRRCQGDSVRLTAAAGYTYLWSNGDTARIIYAQSAGPYNVTVTNTAGCSAVSASDTLVILPPVQPYVSISSDAGDTICLNTQVTFHAQSVNGGSTPQYQWKRNGINVSNTATYIGALLHDGETIWCVLTSNATCATPKKDTSETITMTVLPYPSVSISGSSILCSGDTATLTALPSGGSYVWSTGATGSTLQVSAGGSYGVTVTDANGCSAGAPFTVTVSTPQAPVITQRGDTLSTTATAQFYQWYYDGSIIAGAIGPVVAASDNGFYQVATIDSNGCRSSSQGVAISINGVDDLAALSGMAVYPNPSAGSFTLSWTDRQTRDILITDGIGRTIQADENTGALSRQYDLSAVPAGSYYIRVSQNGRSRTMKLILTK